jgi:hypothetical protein
VHDCDYFHAPFNGLYGFIFQADFRTDTYLFDPTILFVRVNEGNVRSFVFDNNAEIAISWPGALYYYLRLNAGDRVDIVVGNHPLIYIRDNGAMLYGFMIEKY